MFIFKVLVLAFSFMIFPMCFGYTGKMFLGKLDKKMGVTSSYISGVMIMWSIYNLIGIPLIMLHGKLSTLSYSFYFLCFLDLILVIIVGIPKRKQKSKVLINKAKIRAFLENIKNPIFWLAVVVIIYQLFYLIVQVPNIYSDDYMYQPMIHDFIGNNVTYLQVDPYSGLYTGIEMSFRYIFTSYYQYLATISQVSGIHSLIVTKTIIPLFFAGYYYLVWSEFGDFIFKGDRNKQYLFVIFIALITIYGGYSQYTITKRMLLFAWNGKSALSICCLPALFVFLCKYVSGENMLKESILLIPFQLAAGMTSLMGVGLAPMMIGSVCLVKAIQKKTLKVVWVGILSSMVSVAYLAFVLLNK